jgi:non-lysosomal glucosylceramidase
MAQRTRLLQTRHRSISCPCLRHILKSIHLLLDSHTAERIMAHPKPNPVWPVLKTYDENHLARIALPLGGIGTGSVSLGGRGDLRDWEIVNRPAKGFVPGPRWAGAPFFALWAKAPGSQPSARVLEGPLDSSLYEGASGSIATNHGLPRFARNTFAAAYPFGQVMLSDPQMPVNVRIEAFNPLVPTDTDASGWPVAVLRYRLHNQTQKRLSISLCASLPNFVGNDGHGSHARQNRNRFRRSKELCGLFMDSQGVDPQAEQWGSMALATTATSDLSYRTAWLKAGWGTSTLDFWDDFSADGRLENRRSDGEDMPIASLCVSTTLAPGAEKSITFIIAWHFPNRKSWTPREGSCCDEENTIGNFYTTQARDAWHAARRFTAQLKPLEAQTLRFVSAFCQSDLPAEVKEAALFNLSTLRTQTSFRTPDGRFYGFEGCSDDTGCCLGSCTHVWNYEQSTAFLFGALASSQREVEFCHALRADGMMNFRVYLPLERALDFDKAAADGQMGCIAKAYRDWQLSGADALLYQWLPGVKKALEFCWIEGGWDADQDGVMEGCQHNTMDVEYYGPNPQMGFWYLCALRAAEEMCRHAGDEDFANRCRTLFDSGSRYLDEQLFNGDYYEHEIRAPKSSTDVAESLRLGAGAADLTKPDYQLGAGCLVDQLIGQVLAHVCGLGYLSKRSHVRQTLKSIWKYNRRAPLGPHFNCLRTYALGDENALLMASYPKERPQNPFPYFTEVMTGFEYAAAVGMLYEGQTKNGLTAIADIRARYDGHKRSPFDEAECGHHYARAMLAWGAVLALTGFHYSGVTQCMRFAAAEGTHFWASGYAWGTCVIKGSKEQQVELKVLHGQLALRRFELGTHSAYDLPRPRVLRAGAELKFTPSHPRG